MKKDKLPLSQISTPKYSFADDIDSAITVEQTLGKMLRNPNVSASDRLVMWLKLRGYSSVEVAQVLRVEESAICNRLAKLWGLYREYADDPNCQGD